MTKKVLISITGIQYGIDNEEAIEVKNIGNYYKQNGKHFILYDELGNDNASIEKNTIKVSDHHIEIIKRGSNNVHMVFQEKEKWNTCYNTPYGDLLIGIDTKEISILEEEHSVDIEIRYGLEMEGAHLSDSFIKIRMTSLDSE